MCGARVGSVLCVSHVCRYSKIARIGGVFEKVVFGGVLFLLGPEWDYICQDELSSEPVSKWRCEPAIRELSVYRWRYGGLWFS